LPCSITGPPATNGDHGEIVISESFGVVLAPDNNPARYFRLAGGVDPAARYDARQGFIEAGLYLPLATPCAPPRHAMRPLIDAGPDDA
jgi:hypothetical protein